MLTAYDSRFQLRDLRRWRDIAGVGDLSGYFSPPMRAYHTNTLRWRVGSFSFRHRRRLL